jgi:hypothetical protein
VSTLKNRIRSARKAARTRKAMALQRKRLIKEMTSKGPERKAEPPSQAERSEA